MNIIRYLLSILLIGAMPAFIEAKKAPKTRLISEITTKYKVCIVIPAYNEEARIEPTIHAYMEFFKSKKTLSTDFLVVANNCNDKTAPICKKLQRHYKNLYLLDLPQGGKGYAVREGFQYALQKNYDLIGFVDADMATKPLYFYELITKMNGHDGVIASRYAKGAQVSPKRPLLRKVGGKIYNFVLRHQFHMPFKDTQCGAKLFTKATLQDIVPHMQEKGWAFDLEVLYLCTLFNRNILETPTTWSDIPGSHLDIGASRKEFTTALYRIKTCHKDLAKAKQKPKSMNKPAKRTHMKSTRTFSYNKLVRDGIPASMEIKGSIVHSHILNDTDFNKALREKLLEEADEVQQAPNRDETIKELADVLEVIDVLCSLHAISKEELIAMQAKKRADKGGFSTKTFLESAEHPQGSSQVEYCLAQADKYPEIKNSLRATKKVC